MEWSEAQQQAAALMRHRKFDDAVTLLKGARDKARTAGKRNDAAQLGGLLASCLMASGRDDDALNAHIEAENDDPSDPFLKLASANFLMNVMNRPAEALARLEPALPRLRQLPSVAHALHALIGTIYLALNRRDDAVAEFRTMSQTKSIDGLTVAGLDLNLVEALIGRNEVLDECRRYLGVVEQRAEDEHDSAMAERARRLLAIANATH
jgi:tetratricopeptide (TPR) repeat protein